MSLRHRLVLTVLALLTLGLGLTAGATFGAMQDWRADHDDELLAVAADEVDAELATDPSGPRLDLAMAPGPTQPAVAAHGRRRQHPLVLPAAQ